jgi:molecular chaperone GrpE
MTQEHPTDTAPVETPGDAASAKPAAQAAPDAPESAAPAAPAPDDRLARLEAENGRLKSDLLYAKAETENVRRRLEQQAEDRGKFAVTQFAKDILTVADNLRRALDAVPPAAREENEAVGTLVTGVEMTERDMLTTFERHGIRPVEAQGSRFDPNFHQAMMEVEDLTQPEGTVVLVMQQGYVLHGRLLRPALVGIAKGGPKAPIGEQVDTSA